MLIHVFDDAIELLARQRRHGAVDEFEIVAAMQIVEDIHDREAMPFDLRAAADIDDADGGCGHGINSSAKLCTKRHSTKQGNAT
jgi:hypothetical protein